MSTPRIHHLNCASMHPIPGLPLEHRPHRANHNGLVCHCLLVETNDGLILIDTGLGLDDVAGPPSRVGRMFWHLIRPRMAESETARRQIEALGFDARDVRHIVLTHLDVDHAGGIGDFPNARIHVLAREQAAAKARFHIKERDRYRPAQWASSPDWSLCEPEGETWYGFESVRALTGLSADILIVPVAGHTRGHAAIAVEQSDGWLLHAGDAYFHRDQMAPSPCCPSGLRLYQALMAVDNAQRRANLERLQQLAVADNQVRVFCSHDPIEFRQYAGT